LNRFGGGSTKVNSTREREMRFGSWAAGLAVVLALGAAPARAEDCPAKSTQMEDILAALNAAPSCDRAMKIFEACEYGTSGDVQFGAAVMKKCEGDFLARLKAARKRAYQRELGVCDRKYRNESGTMYLSFTAFCRAEVAQRYAKAALKGADPSKAR
jgi:hypothetical protein